MAAAACWFLVCCLAVSSLVTAETTRLDSNVNFRCDDYLMSEIGPKLTQQWRAAEISNAVDRVLDSLVSSESQQPPVHHRNKLKAVILKDLVDATSRYQVRLANLLYSHPRVKDISKKLLIAIKTIYGALYQNSGTSNVNPYEQYFQPRKLPSEMSYVGDIPAPGSSEHFQDVIDNGNPREQLSLAYKVIFIVEQSPRSLLYQLWRILTEETTEYKTLRETLLPKLSFVNLEKGREFMQLKTTTSFDLCYDTLFNKPLIPSWAYAKFAKEQGQLQNRLVRKSLETFKGTALQPLTDHISSTFNDAEDSLALGPHSWAVVRERLSNAKASAFTGRNVFPPLSSREMELKCGTLSPEFCVLGWQNGRHIFMMNQHSPPNSPFNFFRLAEQAGFRALAGPSGSTDLFFSAASYLGFSHDDLISLRLAMVAWMVSTDDHSFAEVMVSAEPFGLPFSTVHSKYQTWSRSFEGLELDADAYEKHFAAIGSPTNPEEGAPLSELDQSIQKLIPVSPSCILSDEFIKFRFDTLFMSPAAVQSQYEKVSCYPLLPSEARNFAMTDDFWFMYGDVWVENVAAWRYEHVGLYVIASQEDGLRLMRPSATPHLAFWRSVTPTARPSPFNLPSDLDKELFRFHWDAISAIQLKELSSANWFELTITFDKEHVNFPTELKAFGHNLNTLVLWGTEGLKTWFTYLEIHRNKQNREHVQKATEDLQKELDQTANEDKWELEGNSVTKHVSASMWEAVCAASISTFHNLGMEYRPFYSEYRHWSIMWRTICDVDFLDYFPGFHNHAELVEVAQSAHYRSGKVGLSPQQVAHHLAIRFYACDVGYDLVSLGLQWLSASRGRVVIPEKEKVAAYLKHIQRWHLKPPEENGDSVKRRAGALLALREPIKLYYAAIHVSIIETLTSLLLEIFSHPNAPYISSFKGETYHGFKHFANIAAINKAYPGRDIVSLTSFKSSSKDPATAAFFSEYQQGTGPQLLLRFQPSPHFIDISMFTGKGDEYEVLVPPGDYQVLQRRARILDKPLQLSDHSFPAGPFVEIFLERVYYASDCKEDCVTLGHSKPIWSQYAKPSPPSPETETELALLEVESNTYTSERQQHGGFNKVELASVGSEPTDTTNSLAAEQESTLSTHSSLVLDNTVDDAIFDTSPVSAGTQSLPDDKLTQVFEAASGFDEPKEHTTLVPFEVEEDVEKEAIVEDDVEEGEEEEHEQVQVQAQEQQEDEEEGEGGEQPTQDEEVLPPFVLTYTASELSKSWRLWNKIDWLPFAYRIQNGKTKAITMAKASFARILRSSGADIWESDVDIAASALTKHLIGLTVMPATLVDVKNIPELPPRASFLPGFDVLDSSGRYDFEVPKHPSFFLQLVKHSIADYIVGNERHPLFHYGSSDANLFPFSSLISLDHRNAFHFSTTFDLSEWFDGLHYYPANHKADAKATKEAKQLFDKVRTTLNTHCDASLKHVIRLTQQLSREKIVDIVRSHDSSISLPASIVESILDRLSTVPEWFKQHYPTCLSVLE